MAKKNVKVSKSTSWRGGRRTTTKTKTWTDKKGRERSKSTTGSLNVFGIVLAVLLVVCVARLAGGLGDSGLPTFQSFLKMLGNSPTVPTDWVKYVAFDINLPGWLNWLEIFVETIGDIFSLLAFTITGGINALLYFLYFLRWILW